MVRKVSSMRRSGFTLIETTIAIALLAIVMVNALTLLETTRKSDEAQADQLELQLLASQALDRIVLALVEADEEATLPQNEAPFSDSVINYQASLGVEDGVEIMSEQAQISLEQNDDRIVWKRNPGAANEQQVTWSRYVSDFLIDEIGMNLGDDNGNLLIDEEGLSFNIEQGSVLIRLTLSREDGNGNEITASAETRAAFRN